MVSDSRVRAAALPPPSAPPSFAGQPRAMPWQASSRRTVKSTMASRVASPAEGRQAQRDQLDHVASVRTRGGFPWAAGLANRVVQQPSKMAHAREQCPGIARQNRGIIPCRSHSPQIEPLCRACTACYARLEDRPLGVWVGQGLKEEIAGERGPRRASQRPHD